VSWIPFLNRDTRSGAIWGYSDLAPNLEDVFYNKLVTIEVKFKRPFRKGKFFVPIEPYFSPMVLGVKGFHLFDPEEAFVFIPFIFHQGLDFLLGNEEGLASL
jgi:hypothetical protein